MYYNDRIREIRQQREISQKEMADVIGVKSQQQYSLYETGKRIMDIEQFIKVCKYFDLSADYLIGFIETPIPLSKHPQKKIKKSPGHMTGIL